MPSSHPRTLRSRIARLERADFVGRTRELLVADSLLRADAPASVLLVHGAGGIGKSMLLREIGRRGSRAGWTPFTALTDEAYATERPLLLIDDHQRDDAEALRAAIAGLPAQAVVVVAAREEPDPGWFEGGWEHVTLELPLSPLSAQESRILLARLGLDGDRRQSVIVSWAGGLPLSLRLGATAAREDSQWAPGLDSTALYGHLRRVTETALGGPHARVFALASVAGEVTHALLAEVLPETDAPAALRWLANCGFAESRAGGVALHETVRARLRDELAQRDPGLERELRARVADHLHARGKASALADLLARRDDGAAGTRGAAPRRVPVRAPQPGDEAPIGDDVFFRYEPAHVLVARDGYAIAYSTADATELALCDPRLGPRLRHAEPDSVVFAGDERLALEAALASARENPRRVIHTEGEELHFGPGGLLGWLREQVHRECGLLAKAPIDAEVVRDALRTLHDPSAARPVSRAQLEEAAEKAFGDTADEQLLRQVLVRGYFDPSGSHEAAARELHLSRAAYFRRLRAASERVATWLAHGGS